MKETVSSDRQGVAGQSGASTSLDEGRLCACGHPQEKHGGSIKRGRCWSSDIVRTSLVPCSCSRFKLAVAA